MKGVSPVISSATSRPVTGPRVSPQCPWPNASHSPSQSLEISVSLKRTPSSSTPETLMSK